MENSKNYLQQISKYDYYQERIPEDVNPLVNGFVSSARNIFIEAMPESIKLLIVAPPTKWSSKAKSLNFYAFARFEYSYEVTKILSELLTPLYLESEILPVIKPFEYEYAEFLSKFYKQVVHFVKQMARDIQKYTEIN